MFEGASRPNARARGPTRSQRCFYSIRVGGGKRRGRTAFRYGRMCLEREETRVRRVSGNERGRGAARSWLVFSWCTPTTVLKVLSFTAAHSCTSRASASTSFTSAASSRSKSTFFKTGFEPQRQNARCAAMRCAKVSGACAR